MTEFSGLSEQSKKTLIELKKRLYNKELAEKAERIAAENKLRRKPFSIEAHEAFIKDHPIFSKLHILAED